MKINKKKIMYIVLFVLMFTACGDTETNSEIIDYLNTPLLEMVIGDFLMYLVCMVIILK